MERELYEKLRASDRSVEIGDDDAEDENILQPASSLGPIKVKVLLSSIITLTKVVAKFAFTKVGALYWHKYNSGCKEATGTITQIKVWM